MITTMISNCWIIYISKRRTSNVSHTNQKPYTIRQDETFKITVPLMNAIIKRVTIITRSCFSRTFVRYKVAKNLRNSDVDQFRMRFHPGQRGHATTVPSKRGDRKCHSHRAGVPARQSRGHLVRHNYGVIVHLPFPIERRNPPSALSLKTYHVSTVTSIIYLSHCSRWFSTHTHVSGFALVAIVVRGIEGRVSFAVEVNLRKFSWAFDPASRIISQTRAVFFLFFFFFFFETDVGDGFETLNEFCFSLLKSVSTVQLTVASKNRGLFDFWDGWRFHWLLYEYLISEINWI